MTDPVIEIVTKTIIKVTRAGERDPPKICARAIKELGISVFQCSRNSFGVQFPSISNVFGMFALGYRALKSLSGMAS